MMIEILIHADSADSDDNGNVEIIELKMTVKIMLINHDTNDCDHSEVILEIIFSNQGKYS